MSYTTSQRFILQSTTLFLYSCIVSISGFKLQPPALSVRRSRQISSPLPLVLPATATTFLCKHDYSGSLTKNYGFKTSATKLFSSTSSSTTTNDSYDNVCDVLVLGSGPAARSIASLLAAKPDVQVLLADQNIDKEWPPNYGVWQDEWQAVVDKYSRAGVNIEGGKVGKSIDREWAVTDCYFGGSFDVPVKERLRLDRPYLRVDRHALKATLTPKSDSRNNYKVIPASHFSEAIAPNVYSPPGSLLHDKTGTTIQLRKADGTIVTVRTKLVVDCTGHETKLVLRESRVKSTPPGFQIAYGCLVDVDESNVPDPTHVGPYYKEAMTLFDYRTDHFTPASDQEKKAELAPTFMYAMPLQDNQIFFEETSLVARPALSFQECKDRCFRRLEYLGIKVTKIHEEEFCYIPMGGALPAKDQRVIGLGGAAVMVHPSTGYHLCRCMMGATDVAQVIINGLKEQQNNNIVPNLDRIAAQSYHALWTPDNIRQRNFAVFGGEFLMKQNVVGLRGFFGGFFRLPLEQWAGFLAGWPGLPNNDKHETWYARIWFGLNFIVRLPPVVALDMFASIVGYSLTEGVALPQSVTPLLGEPQPYLSETNDDRVGDVAAKVEARRMMSESDVTEYIPVSFSEGSSMPSSESSKKSTIVIDTDTVGSFQ